MTTGVTDASQATAWAAALSSQAAPSLPPTDAPARAAAQAARADAIHSSCRAELPSMTSRSAREMCATTFTG